LGAGGKKARLILNAIGKRPDGLFLIFTQPVFMKKEANLKTCDANEATAAVAYRLSETIAIYPITPSSPMAESCDEWATAGKKNLWDMVPEVAQLQSEAGVAGAVHGALTAGSMTTTFTASQGLLLMIPNMYKIAGELLPFCMHVTARALATQGLSIFGDHSDVMACRQTGFAMLASTTVQEAQDMAAIAHAASLQSRVPFMHFFDGFRTSHEINTIKPLSDTELSKLMDFDAARLNFRLHGLSPENPRIRGTAQNPDVYFQGREASNKFYNEVPGIVEKLMENFGKVTGRVYKPVEYIGAPDADRVIIAMGSGCDTCIQAANWLNKNGEKTGVIKVRLYRPFSTELLAKAIPASAKQIAVLDRTKEPGSLGEPLLLDVVTAVNEAREDGLLPKDFSPRIIGGRYGLGSKEFTPAMAIGVFAELTKKDSRRRFTVGINDDVTNTSIPYDESFVTEPADEFRAVFYGLGSDGTVGANKNSIKIIGESTDNFAQAYFVYDSKKSGAMTVSHLRFGPRPIDAPYLIQNGSAQFVACHQFPFLARYDVLESAAEGAVFLLNTIYSKDEVWKYLPAEVQQTILDKKLKFYVIDAYAVARKTGMGGRINTVMQTCFFAISGVLPSDEAISHIKDAIKKTYSKKGDAVVQKNYEAVDASVANLHAVDTAGRKVESKARPGAVSDKAPDFVKRVTAVMMANKGDSLPVSAFANEMVVDGTWPTGTTQWEKRTLAQEIPVWDSSICIQCNKCAFVCPHAAIRAKFYDAKELDQAPATFKSVDFRSKDNPGCKFTIQVAPDDCTGCGLCVAACPSKNKADPTKKAINMTFLDPILEDTRKDFDFFLGLPDPDPTKLGDELKSTQFRRPLFEYSGACAGCGETPYIKLVTQLYGDRLLVANATGCSSIYGGNLPTTPYTVNKDGRGPAWSNSLFEDNAEYGLGLRLAADRRAQSAQALLLKLAPKLGDERVKALIDSPQATDADFAAQRERVKDLRAALKGDNTPEAKLLDALADDLVARSVWIFGGDGWAYDIGFGGLDHIFATGRNVNILVLDTEVYSNTGGQMSKSTQLGAIAKFASSGKSRPKKDLGQIAMGYGNVYVASVSLGAKDSQVVQAIQEAESYPGTSLIIAYSHCISHGYNLAQGLEHQKMAVATGYWPLYRYDPRRAEKGEAAFKLDCPAPKEALSKYLETETRFAALKRANPDRAALLDADAQCFVNERWHHYEQLSKQMPLCGVDTRQGGGV